MDLPKDCGSCSYKVEYDGNDFFECSKSEENEELLIIENPNIVHEECPLLDEVLNAKRFRVKYRNEGLYIVIAFRKDRVPREVFIQHAINQDPDLHYMMASWDACTRLCSMALKKYNVHKVARQMKKASRQKNDLPGILAKLLSEWS